MSEIQPWFVKEAIDYLESILNKSMVVFEWGSGGSTIWFADRVSFIYSVEHQQEWFEKTIHRLGDRINCKLIFLPVKPVKKYTKIIREFGELFDLIVIDGKKREICLQEALKCLKPNGYIVFDNINRPAYAGAREILNSWISREFTHSFKGGKTWVTGVYQKMPVEEKK